MTQQKKRSVSVSLDQAQIDQIDALARQERIQTGENVTRSEVVRRIVDASLEQQPTLSPAGSNTPAGGRSSERSDAAAGGVETRQGG